MDIPTTVELNKSAIARIVAGLFALLGLTGGSVLDRISAETRRSILRVLRPAESAVRRLIVIVSKSIHVKASPARPMPTGIVRAQQRKQHISFQLFDERQHFLRQQPRPKTVPPRAAAYFVFPGRRSPNNCMGPAAATKR